MNLQDGDSPLEIRQFNRNAPVKASRAKQRGIERFGTVGRRQNNDALSAVETVHFGEQLVQCLLTFVVAADAGAVVTLFADGINLVDEYDAGGFFIGLLKQVAHLGRTHAHKQFHKFRSGNGKEGYFGFACHSLRQQGLACAGRAHQQSAFGKPGADGRILVRMLQEVHDFLQSILGFLLAGYILEGDAGLLLGNDFRIGFTKAHGVDAAAHMFGHLAHQHLPQQREQRDRENPADDETEKGAVLRGDLRAERDACCFQPFTQAAVREERCFIDAFDSAAVPGQKDQLTVVLIELNFRDLTCVHHSQKVAVAYRLNLPLKKGGKDERVQQHDDCAGDENIVDERLTASLVIVKHGNAPFRFGAKHHPGEHNSRIRCRQRGAHHARVIRFRATTVGSWYSDIVPFPTL